MQIDDVARLAEGLAGVRPSTRQGLAEWRYHGRLVARQLDDVHLVIRAEFDYRDALLRQFPGTFSVPARYRKHMMVVADLASGDAGAIEDALEAAWQLQRSADLRRDGGEVPADDLPALRRDHPRRRRGPPALRDPVTGPARPPRGAYRRDI